jgi:hypothetical protein
MFTRFAFFLAATTLATAAVSAQQNPPSQSTQQQGRAENANQLVTVTGCVAQGPNNTFTLTTTPGPSGEMTGTTATTPAGTKVAKTITYTLIVDPNEIKDHVGHTVQVNGREEVPEVRTKTTDKSTGAASNAQGTSGTSGSKPTVETTTQTQIVARQLTVGGVKMVKRSCDLVK